MAEVRPDQRRQVETRTGEIGTLQVCARQVRHPQVRVGEVCAGQVRAHEIGAAQIGSREVRVGEVRAVQRRAGEIGVGRDGSDQVRKREVRVVQERAGEVRAPEVGRRQVGLRERGAGQIGSRQVGIAQIGMSEIPPARLPRGQLVHAPFGVTVQPERCAVGVAPIATPQRPTDTTSGTIQERYAAHGREAYPDRVRSGYATRDVAIVSTARNATHFSRAAALDLLPGAVVCRAR